MDSNIKNIIIFPDIHGRDFWKLPYNTHKDDESFGFIFLGDYLDPYAFEGIDHDMAWQNLQELREAFSNISDDRKEWLIGNHDLHYLDYFRMCYGCRRDLRFAKDMEDMIKSDEFKIAYSIKCGNGKTYIFTHAGITKSWADIILAFYEKDKTLTDIYAVDYLNSLKKYDRGLSLLWHISWERGGDNQSGSCIWADVHEHLESERYDLDVYKELNIYQVFGHTLSYPTLEKYFIGDNFAMLDCGLPFILNVETGKIEQYIDYYARIR